MRESELDAILDQSLDWHFKGLPPGDAETTVRAIGSMGWNVLAGDLMLPVLVLKERALDHNIRVMAEYCDLHGVALAPHGKTTMAPQLFKRQLDAGAWAMTAATPSQVLTYRAFGIERIILANELVEPVALRTVAAALDADPEFDFYCLVDSEAAVAAMTRALETHGARRPMQVLLELGVAGGRAGCRSDEEARAVARAVAASPVLQLAGLEGFEGIIHGDTDEETLAAVDEFVARVRDFAEGLAGEDVFADRSEVLLTLGGSAFFDRVVAGLTGVELGRAVRVVLRGGCYVTHDSGVYEGISPLAGRSASGPRLEAALEAWGVVLSRPEPDRVIVGMGKRDVAYDLELPIALHVGDGNGRRDVRESFTAFDLNDQHLYVRVPPDDAIAVGDLLACGISHPCTAFDKWRLIPVVDDDYTVVGAVQTFF